MKRMKSRFLALGLSICMIASIIPATAFAADSEPTRGTLTYTEPIAAQYEDAKTFSEGLAAVKKDGKWGYIDKTGKTVIPFSYDYAFSFSEGLAVVGQTKDATVKSYDGTDETFKAVYWGFINPANKFTPFLRPDYNSDSEALAPMYLDLEYYDVPDRMFFHNGYALVDAGLYGTDGKGVAQDFYAATPFNEGLAFGRDSEDNYVFFDTNGKVVLSWGVEAYEYYGPKITDEYGYEDQSYRCKRGAISFNQGLAPVWLYDYNVETGVELDRFGFIDKTGAWVIAPQYHQYFYSGTDTIQELFGETGLAMVANADGKYGAITKSGAVAIPFTYEELWPFSEGFSVFMQNGKCGFMDSAANTVISPKYEKASSFNNGCAVVYDGTKAFLINRDGTPIPGADKLNPDTYFKEEDDGTKTVFPPSEYVIFTNGGKYGFGKIAYNPPLPAAKEMDTWAFEEVTGAIEANLVPSDLQNLYLNNINRAEFCNLIMQAVTEVKDKTASELVKTATGKELYELQSEYPFNDISDSNIIAAHALGIVNGRGNSTFDPYSTITRQEAAGFLMRAAKVLGADMTQTSSTDFADAGYVDVWFQDAVNFVHAINVMSGTGDNAFSPFGTYTREQSYVTIYRLFKNITAK